VVSALTALDGVSVFLGVEGGVTKDLASVLAEFGMIAELSVEGRGDVMIFVNEEEITAPSDGISLLPSFDITFLSGVETVFPISILDAEGVLNDEGRLLSSLVLIGEERVTCFKSAGEYFTGDAAAEAVGVVFNSA